MLSWVQLFAVPWPAAYQASLSSTISWSLLKFMSIELVILSNHLILSCPLLLPSIFPSIKVFSNESALYIRQPKYWSFSFSISPSNEYSELISFRIDWFAVQGNSQESSPASQFESINSSVLSLFFFFYSLTLTLYLSLEFRNSGYAVISTNFFFKERNDKKWVGYYPRSILQLSLPCSGPWKLTSTLRSLPPAFCWVHTVESKAEIRIWMRQWGWGISFCTPVSFPPLHPHCLVSTGELTSRSRHPTALSYLQSQWSLSHLSLESLTQS